MNKVHVDGHFVAIHRFGIIFFSGVFGFFVLVFFIYIYTFTFIYLFQLEKNILFFFFICKK